MSVQPQQKFTLVLHIGAGKTGTSSIQESLRRSREYIKEYGFDYWGLVLEFAPVQKYSWQKPAAQEQLATLQLDQAQTELKDILCSSIKVAKNEGIETAIWSNEYFFGKAQMVGPVLRDLYDEGVNIQVLMYVRRHDKWAHSAYLQWGIKHKNYPGKIIPFSHFVNSHPPKFYPAISGWKHFLPAFVRVRNFDVAEDIVDDFSKTLNLPPDITRVRANDSPGPEELLLRAIFNNIIQDPALPSVFDNFFMYQKIDGEAVSSSWFCRLLPDADSLSSVVDEASSDIEKVNQELVDQGQPALEFSDYEIKDYTPDRDVLISLIYQLFIREKFKVNELKKQVEGMQREICTLKKDISAIQS